MEQEQQEALQSHRIIEKLAACGHFLHFKMGEKAGRRRVFSVLLQNGEIAQRELQELLGIQSGSLSEILAKMQADGFIEKIKNQMDKRQMNLCLTKTGTLQANLLQNAYEEKLQQLLECFSSEEKRNFLVMLDRLVAHWDSLGLEESASFRDK